MPDRQLTMRKVFLKITILLIMCFNIQNANAQSEYCTKLRKNSIFLEVGGNGIVYSINYDRLFDFSNKIKGSARIGVNYFENFNNNESRIFGIPVEFSGLYSISKNKHFLELGTGLTYFNSKKFKESQNENVFIFALRLGYRYQNPEGGLFLKAGFTPLNNFPDFEFWVLIGGISIGYTFK